MTVFDDVFSSLTASLSNFLQAIFDIFNEIVAAITGIVLI